MWSRVIFKKYVSVWACALLAGYSSEAGLNLKRVLVLSKRTRYELEKLRKPGVSDAALERIIRKRGSDFETLIRHHYLHKDFHSKLINQFRFHNIEVHSVDRSDYTEEAINWADLIVPAGGDGTFLLAASKVRSRDKPVIGFNSDPQRSEGYLCLPKYYSYFLSRGIEKILKNEFKWMFRNRIEIELKGPDRDPVQLDECPYPSFEHLTDVDSGVEKLQPVTKVLPYLALNEVFVGESLSSQVSYFEVEVEGHPRTKVKCSGLCVATGTGSTSWHLSINRISPAKLSRLINLLPESFKHQDQQSLIDGYNSSLIFPPDDIRMYYTLREVIMAGVWPEPPGLPAEGFISSMLVASKCAAAHLVIDGNRCYPFDDGTTAVLSSAPHRALRTILFT